jgi:nucleotide-binding universal stress UspA family protein
MFHPGTIIVASDHTATSDRATDRAVLLAKQWAAPLVLLHIVEGEWSDAALEERAVEALKTLLESDATLAETIVRRGEVQHEIIRLAEERSAALIVTGVARFNNVRDFFLGTAVDHLVRHAPVPVLVVKRRARRPWRRILVATDFSPFSELALRAAVELFPQASLTLWHNCHASFEAWLDKDETTSEIVRQAG